MATILQAFQKLHPGSAKLYAGSLTTFPSGVTHDIRHLTPFSIFIDHAKGSHKWDVDGNDIIDFVMGHGALFLGHSYPALVDAVSEQVRKGTHYGASHEQELRWGRLVQELVPSAEAVRFTSSGTEATLMAIRLARAYTGRDKILKFDYHFHGWHDSVVGARFAESDIPRSVGVPAATLSNTLSIPQNDIKLVEERLAQDDVACVILEPSGASWGTLPLTEHFLADLRETTRRYGTLLIFDEVVTGFRVSSGGVQKHFGISPDLTTLAKILAGGLPGGAVVGKGDILSLIEFRDDAQWNESRRIAHPGTYNANPLSAAAGTTMLSLIGDGQFHAQADALNSKLVAGLNRVLEKKAIPGCAYGLASYFHIALGQECPRPKAGIEWPWEDGNLPARTPLPIAVALKRALLNHGVDLMGMTGGFVSGVHKEGDIDSTIDAFEAAVGEMQAEGIL